jgi:hypothetical protein
MAIQQIVQATFVVGIAQSCIIKPFLAWRRRRRALILDAKDDLKVLNSPSTLKTPLNAFTEVHSHSIRRGVAPEVSEMTAIRRRQHKTFCAKWARAAKVRFLFVQMCQDTPLNRGAVHRWLLGQWRETYRTQIGSDLHKMDVFLRDTIEMAFLPTDECVAQDKKSSREVKKQARMEFYNERKFVEGWK